MFSLLLFSHMLGFWVVFLTLFFLINVSVKPFCLSLLLMFAAVSVFCFSARFLFFPWHTSLFKWSFNGPPTTYNDSLLMKLKQNKRPSAPEWRILYSFFPLSRPPIILQNPISRVLLLFNLSTVAEIYFYFSCLWCLLYRRSRLGVDPGERAPWSGPDHHRGRVRPDRRVRHRLW